MNRLDRLGHMMALQKELQMRLNGVEDVKKLPQTYYNTMTMALMDELMEALRETPWKPWKKGQTLDYDRVKDELVDAWHFLMNLMLWTGMDATELYTRYQGKNLENHRRQDEDY